MLSNEHIKRLAEQAGFDLAGLARCGYLADNEAWFRYWLAHGYQSSLDYMERNQEKRFDPRKLVENAKTAVVCAVSYKNAISAGYPAGHRAKVASYACNTDYHKTLKKMLKSLMRRIAEEYPGVEGRMFVDTAPLAEKQLAVEAGLGWIGRQSLLVTPSLGTFVLLGELILCDEADEYDKPIEGAHCGACHRCVDACPNHAITEHRMIDTNRCISCHTIEREPRADADLHGWIFGCDLCQSCCPYNRHTPQHRNPAFDPILNPLELTPEDWLAMTEEEFTARLGTTPMTRSGLDRIKKNVNRK